MSDMIRFWSPVLVISAILVTISIVLMKILKNKPLYMYVPSLMIWLVSIALFIYAIFFARPMEDIGFLVMAMIAGIATFIVFVLTMVLDVARKRKDQK